MRGNWTVGNERERPTKGVTRGGRRGVGCPQKRGGGTGWRVGVCGKWEQQMGGTGG